jgi:5-methylcytosine-specific restriction endonuclease McrA
MKKTRTVWTPEQEQYIVDNYLKHGALYCAERLDKTVVSVRLRATKLGIKRYKKWDTENINIVVKPNNNDISTQIAKLKIEGFSNSEIAKKLGIARSKVYYHSNPEYRALKIYQNKKRKNSHTYISKLITFTTKTKINNRTETNNKYQIYSKIYGFTEGKMSFDYKDIINKFGEKPKCYLTGVEIDIDKPKTFSFDHKIPRSRGGENSLENLGICTSDANQAKRDKTPEEFIELCKMVVNHNSTNS